MKRKFIIWITTTISLVLVLNLVGFIYVQIVKHQARVLFEQVKNHDRLYVYETYYKALNPVFYVIDIQDTGLLINYYSKLEKLDTPAYITFDNTAMFYTLYQPIYVCKNMNKGSKIIQLADFDMRCWGYFKAYFYKPTTHFQAPPDSLVKKEETLIENDKQDKSKQVRDRISKKNSVYGWFCDY
jgi:hypothetical protein